MNGRVDEGPKQGGAAGSAGADARVVVLVPAAGSGERMGGVRKPLLRIGGRTALELALERFLCRTDVVEVVVAMSPGLLDRPPAEAARGLDSRVRVVEGGASRFESVARAFASVRSDAEVVAVHDGARPFPPAEAVEACIRVAARGVVAVAGIPVADTLKRVDERGVVAETIPRTSLWRAQTPQAFPRRTFARAVAHCRAAGASPTDDAAMAEAAGARVQMVAASATNLKITLPNDLLVAKCLRGSGLA